MTRIIVATVLCLSLSAPALACEGTRLAALVAASSPGTHAAELDAGGVESSEGAAWRIYNGTVSGKPVNIIRTVYGEMGRSEDRLVIADAEAYAVVVTSYRYSAPITDPDMQANIVSRDVYTFCNGAVQRPDGMADTDFARHEAAAQDRRSIFRAPEIADYAAQVELD